MRRSLVCLSLFVVLLVLSGCGVAVPDVKAMTVEKAAASLETAGFKVGQVTYDEKSSGLVGAVVSQTPEGGKHAKEGSLVVLTVAGPPPVATPNLVGLTRDEASATLSASHLVLGEVTQSWDTSVPAGAVTSQTPAVDEMAPRDSAVAVNVSKGPEPIMVPNTKGKTEAKATAVLKAAGFKVKVVKKDNKAKKGTVIEQSPKGKKAQPGSTVKITVSTGVDMVRVPDFISRSNAYAAANGPWPDGGTSIWKSWIRAAGFNPKVVWRDGMMENDSWQTPRAGTLAPRGSLVTLVLGTDGGEGY